MSTERDELRQQLVNAINRIYVQRNNDVEREALQRLESPTDGERLAARSQSIFAGWQERVVGFLAQASEQHQVGYQPEQSDVGQDTADTRVYALHTEEGVDILYRRLPLDGTQHHDLIDSIRYAVSAVPPQSDEPLCPHCGMHHPAPNGRSFIENLLGPELIAQVQASAWRHIARSILGVDSAQPGYERTVVFNMLVSATPNDDHTFYTFNPVTHEVRRATHEEWSTWFDTHYATGAMIVQQTQMNDDIYISTVFTGLNRQLDPMEPPMIFETKMFHRLRNENCTYDYYATYDDALAGHHNAMNEWRMAEDESIVCADCGVRDLEEFYTGQQWNETLCESCFEKRQEGGHAKIKREDLAPRDARPVTDV